jgi:hypothetical protein
VAISTVLFYVRWAFVGWSIASVMCTLPFVARLGVEHWRLWREGRRFRKELRRL